MEEVDERRRAVQLRHHPLMTRKSGVPTWPPKWTTTRLNANGNLTGEIGTLQQALNNRLVDNKIFLFIDYDGSRYMGFMHFDDPQFCSRIFTILQANVGRSIKHIGGLDLSVESDSDNCLSLSYQGRRTGSPNPSQ